MATKRIGLRVTEEQEQTLRTLHADTYAAHRQSWEGWLGALLLEGVAARTALVQPTPIRKVRAVK